MFYISQLSEFPIHYLHITFYFPFLASQDAQEVMLVTESALADFTDVTLVSEDAAHDSLQMSSSGDLTDVSEARDLIDDDSL